MEYEVVSKTEYKGGLGIQLNLNGADVAKGSVPTINMTIPEGYEIPSLKVGDIVTLQITPQKTK